MEEPSTFCALGLSFSLLEVVGFWGGLAQKSQTVWREHDPAVLVTLVKHKPRIPPDPKPCFQTYGFHMVSIWFPFISMRHAVNFFSWCIGTLRPSRTRTPCLFDTAQFIKGLMPICEVFTSAELDRSYQTMQQNGVAILNDRDDFNQTLASAFAVSRCHKWVNTSHWSGQKIGLQFVLMLFNGVWMFYRSWKHG